MAAVIRAAANLPEYWTVGGLSNTSKMPGYSYSLPATSCKRGTTLNKRNGTICNKCYARKGRYMFPNVQGCLDRRLASLRDMTVWTSHMVTVIGATGSPFFRWHDSGDLQSIRHLRAIAIIAQQLPGINFWLPTRERGTVRQYLKKSTCPDNLCIRISADIIDGAIPDIEGLPVSTVHTRAGRYKYSGALICPAPGQGGQCRDCRCCWNTRARHISYLRH